MQHIELIGISGSGKTTLWSELLSANPALSSLEGAHGQVVCDRVFPDGASAAARRLPDRALFHFSRLLGLVDRGVHYFCTKYPRMLPRTGEYLDYYTDDPDRRDNLAKMILGLVERFGTVEHFAHDDLSLVIDEGFAHRVSSVLCPPRSSRSYSEDHLRKYVGSIPVPDYCLFLRASPRVCEARMRSRRDGYPRGCEDLGREEYVSVLEESEACMQATLDLLAAEGTTVIEVDTEDAALDDVVARVTGT